MGDSLCILTPWYPSPVKPFGGAFVRSMATATLGLAPDPLIIHLDEWPLPAGPRVQRQVRTDLEALLRSPTARPKPVPADPGRVLRVPVPIVPRSPYALAAEAHTRTLAAALDSGTIDADVIHAHVALPAGLAAVRLARPGARVIVTEHATFLSKVLARDDGRDAYREVLEGCTAFLCVSELLRDEVLETFPQYADKVHVASNAIPFSGIPMRSEPVTELRRWLYVGSLQERKGVRHLLEAFAICHLERPDLTLTLVGGGPQEAELAERVAQLGLTDAVDLRPPVEPDEVFPIYLSHDLLVHPSRYETFGMTIVEAVATGMPVLVTRCGGPEESLAGIESDAGRLVDVGDGPYELVRGFRDLSRGMAELDLAHARAVLEDRYGYPAIARTLRPFYVDAAPSEEA